MNNSNLENQALSLLARIYYEAGYRSGVKHGIACSIGGLLVGVGVAVFAFYKDERRSKKKPNNEN